MIVPSLLQYVQDIGVKLLVRDNQLIVEGDEATIQQLTPLLKDHKPLLIHYLSCPHTSTNYCDQYEERAAMYEYEANYERNEAESWARREVLERYIKEHMPELYASFLNMITNQIRKVH